MHDIIFTIKFNPILVMDDKVRTFPQSQVYCVDY